MGYRLSKIYTRTGDKGTTGLGDGSRVPKDDVRVEAYGTVDELNSSIGMIIAEEQVPEPIKDVLTLVQHHLFDLGGELCLPGYLAIKPENITFLEESLDKLNDKLAPLKEFILPGGHPGAAVCHLARTICRRAERRVFTLSNKTKINEQGLIYLNRLSDLLFVIARSINKENNIVEPLWKHERKKD